MNHYCFIDSARRIVVLGKTGDGKSLTNILRGEPAFNIDHYASSGTRECHETKTVDGRSLTLIDTPGFFDPSRSEKLEHEMLSCITECAPGPHAFLIVLKAEKFTEHEKAVIAQLCEHFSEDVLKYAAVVFTHGDQLPEGMKIKDFVNESEALSDLVTKCGSRCHVIDNKYWKNNQEDEYRSNKFQVAELLNSIEDIVTENNGGYYTNEKLQTLETEIQKEENRVRKSSENLSQEEIRKQAKNLPDCRTWNSLLPGWDGSFTHIASRFGPDLVSSRHCWLTSGMIRCMSSRYGPGPA
uniref:AIG1-type G domain-containing protein n=1 Tax=Maylandia zebra TaxID=106582 RepID=A0A3P9CZ07_9CICH